MKGEHESAEGSGLRTQAVGGGADGHPRRVLDVGSGREGLTGEGWMGEARSQQAWAMSEGLKFVLKAGKSH